MHGPLQHDKNASGEESGHTGDEAVGGVFNLSFGRMYP